MKRTQTVCVWILVFQVMCYLTPTQVRAELIFILAPEGARYELTKYLEIRNDSKSYATYTLNLHPSSRERKRLVDLFEKAQTLFLNGENASPVYRQIVKSSRDQGWKGESREIIFVSFLRLAEYEKAKEEDWLDQAFQFAPDLKPDPKIFSPPLIAKARQAHNKIKTRSILWKPRFQDWARFIVLDGQVYEARSDLAIWVTPGMHRLEIHSDSALSEIHTLDSQKLVQFQYTPKPILSGECENPEFAAEPDLGVHRGVAFYSLSCIKKRESYGWTDLHSSGAVQPISDSVPASFESSLPMPQKTGSSSSWIWWVVGGLALGSAYLIYQNNQKRSEPAVSPTHEAGL